MHPHRHTPARRQRWKRLAAAALLCAAAPALAALQPGTKAPAFSAPASLGGKVFDFSLADALRQGPVVLYFYPAAFTSGCTVEAHEFAEASDQFKALGASLIGVSHDDIGTLKRFSVSECRSKFAVAADPDQSIAHAYRATLWFWPGHADRTSFVIAPDGKVIYEYSALSPDAHVRNTLEALRRWRAAQQR
ncbi:MAG: peroxiredoxin [Nevskia sp.]|nr:peroxiredoxin [Nevskia sp.]